MRKHLNLAVICLVGQQADFKHWQACNQQRGLPKMASIVKLIGKLTRIVIGMVQRGETYRSTQPQPSAAFVARNSPFTNAEPIAGFIDKERTENRV